MAAKWCGGKGAASQRIRGRGFAVAEPLLCHSEGLAPPVNIKACLRHAAAVGDASRVWWAMVEGGRDS